jgi:hypothetical protein
MLALGDMAPLELVSAAAVVLMSLGTFASVVATSVDFDRSTACVFSSTALFFASALFSGTLGGKVGLFLALVVGVLLFDEGEAVTVEVAVSPGPVLLKNSAKGLLSFPPATLASLASYLIFEDAELLSFSMERRKSGVLESLTVSELPNKASNLEAFMLSGVALAVEKNNTIRFSFPLRHF